MPRQKKVQKRTVKKKVVRKITRKKPAAGRTAVRKAPVKKVKAARKVKKGPARSAGTLLGRARISGTAELDQYFLKDYEARQVFTFLGVKTLKELETYSPQEIVERLTAPMVQTVNRIRKSLAMQNRCLANDQKFAVEFKQQMQATMRK